jgi:hypothetical protein
MMMMVVAVIQCFRLSYLNNLYPSLYILLMLKPRRIRRTTNSTCGKKMGNVQNILMENLSRRDQIEDLGAEGRILLKLILWKHSGLD